MVVIPFRGKKRIGGAQLEIGLLLAQKSETEYGLFAMGKHGTLSREEEEEERKLLRRIHTLKDTRPKRGPETTNATSFFRIACPFLSPFGCFYWPNVCPRVLYSWLPSLFPPASCCPPLKKAISPSARAQQSESIPHHRTAAATNRQRNGRREVLLLQQQLLCATSLPFSRRVRERESSEAESLASAPFATTTTDISKDQSKTNASLTHREKERPT